MPEDTSWNGSFHTVNLKLCVVHDVEKTMVCLYRVTLYDHLQGLPRG